MKRLLAILSVAALMTACNSNTGTTENAMKASASQDTAGMAQFQAWKEENAKKALIDSVKRAEAAQLAEERSTAKSSKRKTKTAKSGSIYKSESLAYETSNPAKQKKRWSKKAKGTLIGVGTGAAAGAIINKKNRVVGGVIGGVVGGATGYGIGRHEDKKDGRQ